jgi:hypothetical protein
MDCEARLFFGVRRLVAAFGLAHRAPITSWRIHDSEGQCLQSIQRINMPSHLAGVRSTRIALSA